MPFVSATEKWIRDRVGVRHDAVADVKSLALPGTYREKIYKLGRSVMCFTSLRKLDLSNNALTTLEGLNHLKELEHLNLYYNNIGSLSEVFRLHHNVKLQVLDLRLNPVTTEVSEYRLFVVHMLVCLRVLDQRSVRSKERQAALKHFSAEEAAGMNVSDSESTERDTLDEKLRPDVPRCKLVKSLASHPSALDEDVVCLIDQIQQSGGDLSRLPILTGHSHQSQHALVEIPQQDKQASYDTSLALSSLQPAPSSSAREPGPKDAVPLHTVYDATNTAAPYYVRGHATSHPSPVDGYSQSAVPSGHRSTAEQASHTAATRVAVLNEVEVMLDEVIALVRKHTEFTGLATGSRRMSSDDLHMQLRARLLSVIQKTIPLSAVEVHRSNGESNAVTVCRHCEQTQRELSATATSADTLHKEVMSVKARADAAEAAMLKAKAKRGALKRRIRDLNQALAEGQVASKQVHDLQKTVATLQESQVALVNCNDRLLLEIEEMRRNHQIELDQLHWSCEQLRKLKASTATMATDTSKQTSSG